MAFISRVGSRLEDVTSSDRIIVMDGGVIVEDGSPAALRAAGGKFAELAASARLSARRSTIESTS